MVCKAEEFGKLRRQEYMKNKKDAQESEVKEREARQEVLRLQCNKAKCCRFKRSCFSEEDEAASSAIFLLACIVCTPNFTSA